jgi:starch-binding outer membrane protein, SusD/RagB family
MREEGFKDVILLRMGEVYITLAEAYVRTNQVDKAVNTITDLRKRTLIPGREEEMKVTASDMNIDFILEEGARELGCELNRWYMLKRSGKLVEWVKKHNPDISLIQDYHIYRPLPQDALYEVSNLDQFVQNKGYK